MRLVFLQSQAQSRGRFCFGLEAADPKMPVQRGPSVASWSATKNLRSSSGSLGRSPTTALSDPSDSQSGGDTSPL